MLGPIKRYCILSITDGHRRVQRAETAAEALRVAEAAEAKGAEVFVSFPEDPVELPLKQFRVNIHGIGIEDA